MAREAEVAAALLRDFGVPVVVGSTMTAGYLRIREIEDTDEGGFQVQRRARVLLVVPGSLGGASRDTPLTIGGVPYVLHRRLADEQPGLELWAVGATS